MEQDKFGWEKGGFRGVYSLVDFPGQVGDFLHKDCRDQLDPMMQEKTRAIVLTSVKYGESDLIVKCLTEEGLRSYMVRRAFSSRNKKVKLAYFQPLSQLEITGRHNTKGRLHSIGELRSSYFYRSLSTDVFKQAIAMFLAEVLVQVIREEDNNPELFDFVETALIWLDNHDRFADFHLLFLLRITRFLGFFPDTKNLTYKYFDMEEACFSKERPTGRLLEGEKLILFRVLIGIKFDDLEQLKWNSEKRQLLLMELLGFYELHLPGFRLPNSLKVLKEVFNEIS